MKKTVKYSLLSLGTLLVIALSIGLYFFYQPHRDVQASNVDISLAASSLVSEFLSDYDVANNKYLDEEGESKILLVSGEIAKIEEDYQGNTVIILQSGEMKAGVSCTLLPEEKEEAKSLKTGDPIKIKGVIRAGATYDEDLEMYESVILEKGAIIK